jgi:predicted nucleic-acid-binding Zn-ribbon protein
MADYQCTKCGNGAYVPDGGELQQGYRIGEFRAAGGLASAIFDTATECFSYTCCARCSYTEFYSTPLSNLDQVLDFLGS